MHRRRSSPDPVIAGVKRWRGRLNAIMDLVGEIERLVLMLIGTIVVVLTAGYGAYHMLRERFDVSAPRAEMRNTAPAAEQHPPPG